MNFCDNKKGLTLVEMLVVVGIIAALAAMMVGIAERINQQGKEQLTRSTLALVNTALEEFRGCQYGYDDPNWSDFAFPLDCNDFLEAELATALEQAAGVQTVSIPAGHDPNYSGSEGLYFFLQQLSASRKILDAINAEMLTDTDDKNKNMTLVVDSNSQPLIRFVDPWGNTLRYDYYDEAETDLDEIRKSRKNFPEITSAGPDGDFDTADDIKNK